MQGGLASSLRMRAAISLGQWQPWTAVSALLWPHQHVCIIMVTKTQNNLNAKLQNSNENSTFSWVSLIELRATQPRSYAFGLA